MVQVFRVGSHDNAISVQGKSTDLCVWLLVASPFVFGTVSAMVDQNIGAARDGIYGSSGFLRRVRHTGGYRLE
jgi:hypothetical protein